MKNSYLIVGTIVLVALLAFVFASKKTEAPVQKSTDSENNLSSTVVLEDGLYRLDTSSSSISWEGEYLTGLKEHGTVLLKSGEVTVISGIIKSGEFVIDMNTIESEPHKDKLVNHLKSDDFFGVEKFSTATFTLKSMTPANGESVKGAYYVISGDLTVRGITKPVSFVAMISSDENTISSNASFAINRATWEIKYNSQSFFSNLGDKIIRDAVIIGLDFQAQKVLQ